METQYQVQAQESVPDGVGGDGNFYMGRSVVPPQLADDVYIFYDKDQPGIHFFDRTPKKLADAHPGKYQTDIPSISEAKWNDKVNKANSIQKVVYPNNSKSVTTIIISVEEYVQLLEEILDAKSREDQKVFFDLEDKIRLIQLQEKVASTLEDDFSKPKNENMNDINNSKEFLSKIEFFIKEKSKNINKNLNSERLIVDSKDIAQADKVWQMSESEMINNIKEFEKEFENDKKNENDITKE